MKDDKMPQKTSGRPIVMPSRTTLPLALICLLPSLLPAFCLHFHCCPWFPRCDDSRSLPPAQISSPDLPAKHAHMVTPQTSNFIASKVKVIRLLSQRWWFSCVPAEKAAFLVSQYPLDPHIQLSSAHAWRVLMFLSLWTFAPLCQGHPFHWFDIWGIHSELGPFYFISTDLCPNS